VQLTGDSEFLVIACDGLFEAFDPQELCDFARDRLKVRSSNPSIEFYIDINYSLFIFCVRLQFGEAGRRGKR